MIKEKKKKYYTDQERYEFCRRCKISGQTINEFAKENGICRSTLRDWMYAYKNINGKFINVNTVAADENNIISNESVKANILSEIDKKSKSSHFSRFDHSIVVIEYKEIKITTSLEQAERLLEKII
mgnify:CR=1 FL=1